MDYFGPVLRADCESNFLPQSGPFFQGEFENNPTWVRCDGVTNDELTE